LSQKFPYIEVLICWKPFTVFELYLVCHSSFFTSRRSKKSKNIVLKYCMSPHYSFWAKKISNRARAMGKSCKFRPKHLNTLGLLIIIIKKCKKHNHDMDLFFWNVFRTWHSIGGKISCIRYYYLHFDNLISRNTSVRVQVQIEIRPITPHAGKKYLPGRNKKCMSSSTARTKELIIHPMHLPESFNNSSKGQPGSLIIHRRNSQEAWQFIQGTENRVW